MKGFAMLEIGKVGWVEKPKPVCGPMDAVCRPLAAAVCTISPVRAEPVKEIWLMSVCAESAAPASGTDNDPQLVPAPFAVFTGEFIQGNML